MTANAKNSAAIKPTSAALAAVRPAQAGARAVAPLPLTRAPAKANSIPTAAKSGPAAKEKSNADAKAVTKPKSDKVVKAKRVKLVRDSFTIPKHEYAVIDDLKQRANKLGKPIKKSELLRAGILALAAMSGADFLASLQVVQIIKTGRPAKN